jgi:hypothetical protein
MIFICVSSKEILNKDMTATPGKLKEITGFN